MESTWCVVCENTWKTSPKETRQQKPMAEHAECCRVEKTTSSETLEHLQSCRATDILSIVLAERTRENFPPNPAKNRRQPFPPPHPFVTDNKEFRKFIILNDDKEANAKPNQPAVWLPHFFVANWRGHLVLCLLLHRFPLLPCWLVSFRPPRW